MAIRTSKENLECSIYTLIMAIRTSKDNPWYTGVGISTTVKLISDKMMS